MAHTCHTLLWLLAAGCTPLDLRSDPSTPEALQAGPEDDTGAPAAEPRGQGEGSENPDLTLLSDLVCETPCTFRTGGSVVPAQVLYQADGWDIGQSVDASEQFAVTYDFASLGDRFIQAIAFDAEGNRLGAAGAWIEVRGPGGSPGSGGADEPSPGLPEVPYFYQYDNGLYPGSTCQNTVIAMVLAAQGWSGDPDVITAYWGKDYAQTPSGFSDLLTREAAYWGLDVSSLARTNASFADLNALLDRGLPVPVHGYFTGYGHVVLVLGYDSDGYWVHDPAGAWTETFGGGYPGGYAPTAGQAIHYPRAAFEAAVGTADGRTPLPLWIHELRL